VRRVAAAAVVLVAVGIAFVDFRPTEDLRGAAPRWSDSLAEARATCRGLPSTAAAPVKIAPSGWTMRLPCRDLLSGSDQPPSS
jgi:hypothetical protein